MTIHSLIRNGYRREGRSWVKDLVFDNPLRIEQIIYHPDCGRLTRKTKRQFNEKTESVGTS